MLRERHRTARLQCARMRCGWHRNRLAARRAAGRVRRRRAGARRLLTVPALCFPAAAPARAEAFAKPAVSLRRGPTLRRIAAEPPAHRRRTWRRRPARWPRRVSLPGRAARSEEHTSELQSHLNLVCRLLLEKKKTTSES